MGGLLLWAAFGGSRIPAPVVLAVIVLIAATRLPLTARRRFRYNRVAMGGAVS